MSAALLLSVGAVAVGVGGAVASPADEPAEPGLEEPAEPGLVEVAQLPIYSRPGDAGHDGGSDNQMILNPATRLAYQIFERTTTSEDGPKGTVLQSVDLDTLQPRQRVGIPDLFTIGAGGGVNPNPSPGTGLGHGQLVHAVDPGGTVFLPLSERGRVRSLSGVATGNDDFARELTGIAVIDEAALDAGDDGAVSILPPPSTQSHLVASHNLRGLEFHRPEDSPDGKLTLLFAGVGVTNLFSQNYRPVYDHYLTQWDVATGQVDWEVLLQPCARGPLIGPDAFSALNQLQVMRAGGSLWLGCQSQPKSGQAVEIPLDEAGQPMPDAMRSYPLSQPYSDVLADGDGGRLLFRVATGTAGTTWWVFDTETRSFVASVAGTTGSRLTTAGIDPVSGRFYTLRPDDQRFDPATGDPVPVRGGLGYTDLRQPTVPQVVNARPDLAYPAKSAILVDPPTRRVFVRRDGGGSRFIFPETDDDEQVPAPQEAFYRVLEDRIPIPEEADLDDQTNTRDVAERDELTSASYLASGSGYGTRALFTGGIEAAAGSPSLGSGESGRSIKTLGSPCSGDDRALVLGHAELAAVSELVATSSGLGVDPDGGTAQDAVAPVARCWPSPDTLAFPIGPVDPGVVQDALFSDDEAPLREPPPGSDVDGFDLSESTYRADCAGDSSDSAPDGSVDEGEPLPGGSYSAGVTCDTAGERAESVASGAFALDGHSVRVASSDSTVVSRRLDAGGAEVTVDSIARGIEFGDVASIGAVRLEVTSQANGRSGKVSKTGATFTRTVCGVTTPDFSQGACTDDPAQHAQLAEVLNRAFGGRAEVRFRDPDPELLEGTESGFNSAFQRDRDDLFADAQIARDRSLAVPGMEFVSFRGDDPDKGPGRQIFQFAGAQASVSYGIECLFGFDAAAGDCATAPPLPGASLVLRLVDGTGEPLAGGRFAVYPDADGDGTVTPGVDLPVAANGGGCETAPDGIGSCRYDNLSPGPYVVLQEAAPDGYAPAEPFARSLAPGTETVTVTNLPATGAVTVSLEDEAGAPLARGSFELVATHDGGPAPVSVATCTTGSDGRCQFALSGPAPAELPIPEVGAGPVCGPLDVGTSCLDVPLGKYVVHQAAAPAGFQPADDIPFSVDDPGDVARVGVVNGTTGADGSVAFARGQDAPPLSSEFQPPPEGLGPDDDTGDAGGGGGPLGALLGAPAKALGLLFGRSLVETLLMAAVWALLFLPAYLGDRQLLIGQLARRGAGSASEEVTG